MKNIAIVENEKFDMVIDWADVYVGIEPDELYEFYDLVLVVAGGKRVG